MLAQQANQPDSQKRHLFCAQSLRSIFAQNKRHFWLPVISTLATTMKPGELYWSLVDPVWDAISIYDGEETFLKQYAAAPLASRTLFAAHWCQSEVRNGGLHQFFGNSTGVLAPEAVSAFQSIGMPKISAVVSEAMSWFGPNYARDREVRDELLGGQRGQVLGATGSGLAFTHFWAKL